MTHYTRIRWKAIKGWSDIFPPPVGEQSIHCTLTEKDGVKLLVSGRIDLLRRSTAEGKIEIVDYKITNGSSPQTTSYGQVQLAIYAQQIQRETGDQTVEGVLEVYSPEMTQIRFSAKELNEFYNREIEPSLHELIEAERDTPRLINTSPSPAITQASPSNPLAALNERLPVRVQEAFDGYVGNGHLISRIQTLLASSLIEGGSIYLKTNIMLFGPGGLGKSELARRIAKALDLPLVELPGSALRRPDDLLEKIDAELSSRGIEPVASGYDSGLPKFTYPPLVIFIDEVHELKRTADKFLNLFEPRERRLVASRKVAHFPTATFIAATTDKGLLPAPFNSRFGEYALEPYGVDEVAEIIKRAGTPGDEKFCRRLALMSRLNPRRAKSNLEDFLSYNQVHNIPATEEGLKQMEEIWRIDGNGFTSRDISYLKALKNRPVGVGTLANHLSVTVAEIERDIEPYLAQNGLINKSEKGREITQKGKELLASR